MQGRNFKNILVVRTDRIGDVVLTLPVVDVLRRSYPDARIAFLARNYTREILVDQEGIDEVVLYDEDGVVKPFGRMVLELRKAKFDLAVVAFPRLRIALILWLAGISCRVGTGYRWYSFLFNKRHFEHRKTAAKHELEYNLSLLKTLGITIPVGARPTITIPVQATMSAQRERQRLGIAENGSVVILHPGSGGSARDWKPSNFGALAAQLKQDGYHVVVTGTTGEEDLVGEVVKGSGNLAISSVGRLGLKDLAAFIKMSRLFVSNSTGPLHIAAAVGTPVIAFYPPIRACSPERWGPVTDNKAVFVPDSTKCELCKGMPCRGNVCMDQIRVEEVVRAARKLLMGHTDHQESQVHQ